MLLTIRTLSCPPPDHPQSIHAQFDVRGGRIGRSAPCKLILPDPNRHISREHAEIRFRDNAFSLKVVSKVNSVLVNDAVVNPGEAVALRDGDQVLIGEYLLRAEVAPAGVSSGAVAVGAPAADPFDLFAGLSSDPPPAVAAPPEWFQAPPPPAAAPPRAPDAAGTASIDELFNPSADPAYFADLLQNPLPEAPREAPRAPPAAPLDHRIDDFLGLDSLASADTPIDPLQPAPPASGLYHASPLDQALGPARAPAPAAPSPPAPAFDDDIFKVLEREFGSPAPIAPEPVPGAPALPAAPMASPAPVQAPIAPAPASSPAVDPLLPDFGELLSAPPEPPAQPPLAGVPSVQAVPPNMAPAAAAARSAVAVDSAGPPVAEAGGSTQRLMSALAESLGLAPEELDRSNPEQTIRLVGELLRMSTDGLFRMLEMRSQLKSELHIEDRTMISSRENNPLKHADSAQEAMAYLVDLRRHGNRLFMPPAKAVEDTIWDICAHEMAVMAGTRAALLGALKMFSPEAIEGRIKKTGALQNVLPALHKSRLWERFLEMHAELEHEAEDHFDRLLDQEFSKAYSEQSRKLKKKR